MISQHQENLLGYIKEIKNIKANVGVCVTGLFRYWPQFPTVKEKIMKCFYDFCSRLKTESDAEVIKFDKMCDCYENSVEAGIFFAKKDIDLLIVYHGTYTPSAYVIQVVKKAGGPPNIVLSLQPSKVRNYNNPLELTTENSVFSDVVCPLPEAFNALIRSNEEPLDAIPGVLYEDERTWGKIRDWCRVVTVARKLKYDHIGCLGHEYEGMLDMQSDPTMFDGYFGMHVEHIEMDDLERIINTVTEEEVIVKTREITEIFDFPEPEYDPIAHKVDIKDLNWPAKVSVAMEKLVIERKLTGLAYYYNGYDNNINVQIMSGMILGNSLLTSKGIAVSGEQDLKNCIAMLITDRFDAGGSFCEITNVDFEGNNVCIGHDGPHHLGVAEGSPSLRYLDILHGKTGSAPSVEYQFKLGPVTILGLTQTIDGKFKMVVAEGESIPGKTLKIGNTATRVKFKLDIYTFLEKWTKEGPTHHLSLGRGHIVDKIEKLAKYLKIECKCVSKWE